MKSETEIKKEIIEGLRAEFPEIKITRMWCGQTFAKKGGLIRGGDPGWPDLIGYLPGGRFLGIEVKRPGGKTVKDRAEKQEAFRVDANNAGCLVVQVESFGELKTILEGSKND